eukprot:CAMPEP_0182888812 /NCGR_PEP_ID=MMETSP0034_2-20130328/21670_1 /TAXON_ID=156128 /ORGANISM="Nephroselmis pyriformis, Strain CCMP717" /LENGTH=160 /DNA_ID=CAMNT_0025022267 /DNA_START=86 /DNA_END=564 /DNA_ORIENTATION=-
MHIRKRGARRRLHRPPPPSSVVEHGHAAARVVENHRPPPENVAQDAARVLANLAHAVHAVEGGKPLEPHTGGLQLEVLQLAHARALLLLRPVTRPREGRQYLRAGDVGDHSQVLRPLVEHARHPIEAHVQHKKLRRAPAAPRELGPHMRDLADELQGLPL